MRHTIKRFFVVAVISKKSVFVFEVLEVNVFWQLRVALVDRNPCLFGKLFFVSYPLKTRIAASQMNATFGSWPIEGMFDILNFYAPFQSDTIKYNVEENGKNLHIFR